MEFAAQNKIIHRLFEATIFMKGLNGLWEIAVGLLLLNFKKETISAAITSFANYSIGEADHVASQYLMKQAANFSSSTQYFLAMYFLFYGIVNLFLVISLWKGKLWAYPAAIIFFISFTVYMAHRFIMYRSWILFFFILFDLFLVILTWLEYERIKKSQVLGGKV